MLSKNKILGALTIGTMAIFLVSVKPTYAFWPFDLFKNKGQQQVENQGLFPPIIQKIIDKFNLSEEEVRGVIEETREERQAKMQAKFEERLNNAVENGKITEEQKQAILAKHEEIKQEKEALKNLSPEERQAKMREIRDEMKNWLEENGIDWQPFAGWANSFKKGFKRDWHFGKNQ